MMISEKIVKKTINIILCIVQWRPLCDRGRIHQTHCTKRSMWGLLNHQTLLYIIKDFFINFIRRRTVWLHKITRYLGHTSLFIFKLHMTRIFVCFNFYLTCKFGQTCKYYKICILHNKISFWRDQISNFNSVYGFVFHSSGYFFEKLLIQCKEKTCYFSDVIIRKKTMINKRSNIRLTEKIYKPGKASYIEHKNKSEKASHTEYTL